jgi:outer membrane protein assembly factor BamB
MFLIKACRETARSQIAGTVFPSEESDDMKNFLRVMSVVAVVLFCVATPAIAQLKGDAQLPTHQQLSRLGLERAWWAQAVLNPHRDKVRHVSIDEDIVYVQATSGVTTAFDAESGHKLWAIQLGRFDPPSFPVISNEDLAMIIVGSTMYGIEKRTGKTLWTLILPGQPSTGPAVDEKHVYFGSLDGMLYAYSLRKIQKLYEERRLPQWSKEAEVWTYKAGKEITSPPITTGRTVNFASRDGSLYSVTAKERKLVYQLETDKAIVAPLARLDNTMFLASEDFTFYALNLFNGKFVWEFTSGLPIRKAPVAVDKEVFVSPDRGGTYCLEPDTGVRRWWKPDMLNFLAMTDGAVAGSDDDGNLVMVSRDKGETIGSLPLRKFNVRPGNDRTDRIYLATESGLVLCLRQIGHSYPVYHRYPDRLPLLPEIEPEEGSETPTEAEMPAETPEKQ